MSEIVDLIDVTIDDVQLRVAPGTLVIRAAEQAGVRIPRFCDHPLLEPVAACRQCLVEVGTPDRKTGEVRFMPKPQPSCSQPVSPGMVVKTQKSSGMADSAQRGVMEFLLINHPLDCPVCDKGGECPLQNQAMLEGRAVSRFSDSKRTFPKPVSLTSQIMLDRERCILCQRCVRFGKEIAGDAFIDLQGRGGGSAPIDDHYFMGEQIGSFDTQVLGFHDCDCHDGDQSSLSGPYGISGVNGSMHPGQLRPSARDISGRAFASYFSGNIVQICPVGALTAASYRFRARPFDLVSTPSVTEHDASGSAIRVDIRRGEVVRRLAGDDPQVNDEWITDKDRFAFEWDRKSRLTTPLIRHEGKLVPTSWSDALHRVYEGLTKAAGLGAIGLLPGGHLTFEDAWAWSKFARTVLKTDSIDARSRTMSEEERSFLASHVAGSGLGVTYEDVEKAGRVLLVALEPEDECGALFLRIRKGMRAGKVSITTIAPFTSAGSRKLEANVIHASPADEVAVVNSLLADERYRDLIDELVSGVILVGERAARTPGLLSAVLALAERTGARLQWVPRRAGERGAIEAGLLPGLLPFGRPLDDPQARTTLGWGDDLPTGRGMDIDEMLAAAGQENGVSALIVGGVDLRDVADPSAARQALKKVDFLVSLEVCSSEIADQADVVLPVAPAVEKNGTFIDWEGRLRPFGQALASRALTDRDVLVRLAREFGQELGGERLDTLYQEVNAAMGWTGPRAQFTPDMSTHLSPEQSQQDSSQLLLATHKPMIDAGRLQDGAPKLAGSARCSVALASEATFVAAGVREGDNVKVIGHCGSIVLPAEVADLPDNVVWVPECSAGSVAHEHIGTAGSVVTLEQVPVTREQTAEVIR